MVTVDSGGVAGAVRAGLQAGVLPLFRTRADLVSWRNVRVYAVQAREGLGMLEDAAADDGPGPVLPVVRKALTSTITACGRADDSSGEIQDVIAGLLALHARLCREEPPPVGKLIEWMLGFGFDRRRWHDFTLDPVDYADALGPVGLDRYESTLLELAAGVPAELSPEDRQAAYRATLGTGRCGRTTPGTRISASSSSMLCSASRWPGGIRNR